MLPGPETGAAVAVVASATLCPVCAAIDAFVASTAFCAARFGALMSMPADVIGAACAGEVIGAVAAAGAGRARRRWRARRVVAARARVAGHQVVDEAHGDEGPEPREADQLPPHDVTRGVGAVLLEGGDHRSPGFEGSGSSLVAPGFGVGAVRAT